MGALTLVGGLTLALTSAAEIYKTVDEFGNVSFTDRPTQQPGRAVEKVRVDTMNTYVDDSPRAAYEGPAGTAESETGGYYRTLAILSPEADAALRDNAGNVMINAHIEPRLLPGDRIALRLDGRLNEAAAQGTRIALSNLPRGSHSIQLVVVDRSGNEKITSGTREFHLQRFSQLHPSSLARGRSN
ncbi:MAG: DUF4124 domain-containing protein [Pseudomonadota bacterium]